jgi:hypothetical protein
MISYWQLLRGPYPSNPIGPVERNSHFDREELHIYSRILTSYLVREDGIAYVCTRKKGAVLYQSY